WIVFPGLAISYMCSAAIGFYMGRWVKLPRLRKRMEEFPKADLLLRKVEQNDFLAIVFSRISPLFPFAVTNFLLSSLNIKFSRYMWANFVGMLPRTILVFYSGIQAKRLSDLLNAPNEMGWAQWATPLFILVSLLGFIYLLSRKANKFYKD
ncbi:MAG: putative membrane protein YdjX (TVP38/TMEM64 family), partial [Sphingobacteriales bacterium]